MSQHGSPPDPPWISRSVALYQRLLVLYPPAFRSAYSTQLVQTFRDQVRQAAREHGLPGLCGCWIFILLDLASNSLAERFAEGLSMPRLILTRLAGGLMLVSVVLLIPLLLGTGTSLFTVGPFTWPTPAEVNITVYYSFPVSSIARFPLIAKFLVACCSAPGLLGVTLAQCRWLGRLSGSLALLGQIGMALFTFLLLGISGTNAVHLLSTLDSTSTISWPWIVVLPFAASLALGLGLTGCGLLTGKERGLAGSKGPLLLLGLWLLVGNLGLGWLQWTNP